MQTAKIINILGDGQTVSIEIETENDVFTTSFVVERF